MREETVVTRKTEAFSQPEPLPGREVAALGLLLVVAFVLLAAFAGPWFARVSTTSSGPPATDDRGFGIFGWSAADTTPSASATVSGTYTVLPTVGTVFLLMGLGTAAVLLLEAAALVLAYRACAGRGGKRFAALGYAAGLGTLALAVVFALAFPYAAETDGLLPEYGFVGSASVSGATPAMWTWGPGWAWYGLVVAGTMVLATVHMLARWHAGTSVAHTH